MGAPRIVSVLLCSAALAGAAYGEFGPLIEPVAGLPDGVRQYWHADLRHGDWYAAASDGLVTHSGSGWKLDRPPGGGEVRLVLPLGERDWVVAGSGQSWMRNERGWLRMDGCSDVLAGVVVGDGVLLAARDGLYHMYGKGAPKKFLDERLDRGVKLARVGTAILMFGGRTGALEWDGRQTMAESAGWAWTEGMKVVSVAEMPEGVTISSDKGVFFLAAGRSPADRMPLLEEKWRRWYIEGLVGAVCTGGRMIVATYTGGLACYSISDGQEIWRVPISAFEGEVYCLEPCPEGFMIGTATGLYILADPRKFTGVALPGGDLYFAKWTSGGLVLGLSGGLLNVTQPGKTAPFPGVVYSLAEPDTGRFVAGRLGKVEIAGEIAKLDGRAIGGLAVIGCAVCAVQPDGVTLIREGRLLRLQLPTANSVASTNHAHFIIGTVAGAFVIDANGVQERIFGEGRTVALGSDGNPVIADSRGRIYDEQGTLIGDVGPVEVLDAAKWRDALAVLVRNEDGQLAVLAGRGTAWSPLEVPLPEAAANIVSYGDTLFVVGPKRVVAASEPLPAQAPAMDFVMEGRGWRSHRPAEVSLSAGDGDLTVTLPAVRLPPWRGVSYAVSVDKGHWLSRAPGDSVRLERMPWGGSTVSIQARWGNRTREVSVSVNRAWPWWLQWPAFLGYLSGIFAGFWGFLRWRMAQVRRRSQELERIVSERTAELTKAQQARSEFFATVSHEIRNPLNGIVGLCQMLDEAPAGSVGERERRLVRSLRGCAEQLRGLVGDVLDFARIDRGETHLDECTFEMGGAIEGAARAADPNLSKTRISAQWQDPELWLYGDGARLRQILTNLVSNALKYGVPEQCSLTAEITAVLEGRSCFVIEVRNTGPTIPPGEIVRIFEGFRRGKDAVSRGIPGAGIGLAVSRKNAELMGGTLTAESKDGLTIFRLEVEFAPAPSPIPTKAPVPIAPSAPRPRSRVLAIEDENYNRVVLGFMLSRIGYEVDWAVDGAAAMECIRDRSYDLILLDFMLPDTTGPELARRITADAKEPKPPMIIVTAYSTVEKMAEARAAGIKAFVTKPISEEKLAAAILGLGPMVTMRGPRDAHPPSEGDFSFIARMENGRMLIAEFGISIRKLWGLMRGQFESGAFEEAGRSVHKLRGQVLSVHAESIAEQLSLLEPLVRSGTRDDAKRIIVSLDPLVEALALRADQVAIQGR